MFAQPTVYKINAKNLSSAIGTSEMMFVFYKSSSGLLSRYNRSPTPSGLLQQIFPFYTSTHISISRLKFTFLIPD